MCGDSQKQEIGDFFPLLSYIHGGEQRCKRYSFLQNFCLEVFGKALRMLLLNQRLFRMRYTFPSHLC